MILTGQLKFDNCSFGFSFRLLSSFLIKRSMINKLCSKADDDHILRKLHPKGIWFLTVLGSTATTQREYIALHAFRRLNLQVTIWEIKRLLNVE